MRKQKREDIIRKKRGEYMEREEVEGSVMTLQKGAMLDLTRNVEERRVVEEWLDLKKENKDVRELAREYSEALKREGELDWG